jgi:putative addiction module component (TIGR02574 family)
MFLRNGQLEKGGNVIAKELQVKTLSLNPIDKIRLVEMLLESLDKADPEIEAAWVAESERRYAAYKRGEIQGATLDEVKKRIRLCS